MGWSEEAMIRAEDQQELYELETFVEEVLESDLEGDLGSYAHAKAALEERMGLEGSHLSLARLRLLDEYNRDEERMG